MIVLLLIMTITSGIVVNTVLEYEKEGTATVQMNVVSLALAFLTIIMWLGAIAKAV
ncbi:hypothetical protein EalM132_00161 [Exiguobacterium phage vB_EalM-132]|nr:hypothetical protein EalM132_00161 [Exiguobacterium phage vB_EalM-132]